MQQRFTLGYMESRSAVETMLKHADEVGGRPVAVAVVDDRGELVCFAAMAGVNAALARQNALKKAYTSAVMRTGTVGFEQRLAKSGQSVADFGNPNLFAGGGGEVVLAPDGKVLGGLGVSGRTNDEDQQIAATGLATIRGLIEAQEAG